MANEGIELEVYSFQDPTQKLDTLEGRQEPTLLDELGVGGGSFKINKNDPKIVANPALLKTRNVVKCKVDGKVVGGWLIQSRKATIVADGERSVEGYEIAGEGLLTWLSDAQVRPYGGLKTTSTDKRAFGFSAPKGDWYKSSDWVLPRGMKRWNTITGNPWKYLPTNWPSDLFPNARWVWQDMNGLKSAPAGNAYFRYDHNFPSTQQSCSLYIATSGAYTVYLDGEQIATSDPVTGYTTKTSYEAKKIDFTVDPGEHVIGIVVSNDKVGPAGLLAGIVYYSDTSPDINLGNVTIDIGTNAFVHRVAHGLANDDAIYLTSTGKLPGGLTTNKTYYVANKSADKFNVQATKTGVYIDTKAAQDGVHTLFKKGATATPHLIHFTGLTQTYSQDNYSNARTKENKARNHYNALPAGSTSSHSTKAQKAQAKKKAAAKTVWDKASAVRRQAKHELDIAFTNANWAANFYPDRVPGPSAGEILITLLDEAQARGVLFPTWMGYTFTSTKDSNGSYWGDALDWEFDIGTSLKDVVAKFADQGIDVWIDPNTYNLNAVINRGYDRTVYHYQSTFTSSTVSGPVTLHAQLKQRMQDLVRSPDTGEFYISQTDDNNNVVITRNSATGTQLDYMTFNGAGHGTTIALEYSGGQVYIWLANTGVQKHWRFPYHAGTYSGSTPPPSTTNLPMFGHSFVSAQLDWLNDRMVLHTGAATYELRKITEYIAGVDKVYAKLAMDPDLIMQGFFTFLDTFYYWTGGGTDMPLLTGYDWSTGQAIASWDGTGLTIGAPNGWWEPEGVSLYNVDGTNPIAYIGMTYDVYPNHTFKAYTLPLRNGIPAVNSTPVVFEKGKNLTGADTQSSGKIKNSLALKTADGWYPTPSQDDASIALYGVIEDTLSTSSTVAATQSLAQSVIRDKSTEEDSATYEFTPTDKIPWTDFSIGDWVIAPDEQLIQQDRRVMSISISETSNGQAKYAIEFDNIFQENEARLNRIIQNMGASGAGSGSASVAVTGGIPTRVIPPRTDTSALVPLPPENVVVTAVSDWDPQGQKAITEAVVTWDAVVLSEDGSDLIPTGYQVWARPIDDDDNSVVWDSTDDPTIDAGETDPTAPPTDGSTSDDIDPDSDLVLDPDVDTAQNPWQLLGTVSATVATVGQFNPGSNWEFGVKAVNGPLPSDWSQILALSMDAPAEPMDPPTAPTLSSARGVLIVNWDGLLVPSGGGTEPVPARFRDVSVGISTVSGGPYTKMGTTTTDLVKQIMVTGLTVGTTYYVVLYAEDKLGTSSGASAQASIVLTGVDLGDLATALSTNLSATASLAANAQSVATAAQTAAGTAQTTANGKNKVFYQGTAPTTGMAEGDLWFNTSNDNAQSSYTSGAWVARALGNGAFANIDAGKITTGTLSASRIAALSIAATQLAIADFTNLFENPTMGVSPTDSTLPRGITSVAGAHGYTGANWYINAQNGSNNDAYAPGLIPVVPGDQFFVSADMYFASSAGTIGQARVGLRFVQADKTTIVNWLVGASTSTPNTAGATTKATYTGSITAPANAAYAQVWMTFSNNGETTNKAYFGNVILRRKATGSLLVDGTITATQIGTGVITANEIKAGTITSNEILAGTITTNNLNAGAIDGMVITGSTFRTSTTATTNGIVINASGINAYQSSVAKFTVNTAGALTAVGANISGTITATSGTISGQLTIASGGSLYSGSSATGSTQTTISSTGITFEKVGTARAVIDQAVDVAATLVGMRFDYASNPKYSVVGQGSDNYLYVRGSGGVQVLYWNGSGSTQSNGLTLDSAGAVLQTNTGSPNGSPVSLLTSVISGGNVLRSSDFNVGDDGSPRIWSSTILGRTYTTAATGNPGSGGSSFSGRLVTITTAGTIGTLDGATTFQIPYAYANNLSGQRAMLVNINGTLGTASSARRFKKDIEPLVWDDETMERWLNVKPVSFRYKEEHYGDEGDGGLQHGFIADDVDEAGFDKMVYYNEGNDEEHQGEVDGFAYERMGVYDHLVLGKMFDRIIALEKELAALKG
jgi:hypothetical protein